MKKLKRFKVRHKATGLYLRVNRDNNYTLSKHGSVLSDLNYKRRLYDKTITMYVNKYTKVYEDTYLRVNWSETYKPTRMFCITNINEFEIIFEGGN